MEHGLTPSAISTRLTYLSAPEAIQSAIAAGLLNVGSQFIGTMENTATLLAKIQSDPTGVEASCQQIAQQHKDAGKNMPGFGHHLHRPDDPRSPKLFAIAAAHEDIDQSPIKAINALGAAVDEIYGSGGIMEGYNPVSMFGRGAAGAIDKRRAGIMKALEKRKSEELQQRLDDLQAARDRITGTIRDASGNIIGGTGQGTIDSGNEGGYGGTGGEGPSAVSSSGMLGGGV